MSTHEQFTRDDWEMWDAGFHGYEGCPYVEDEGCPSPYYCSEAMDCPFRKAAS